MGKGKRHPVHPGEVLLRDFLKPMGLSQNRLALNIGVPLSRYFGTTPQFWLGLQADYDLDVTAEEMGDRLKQEVMVRAKAG